MVILDVNGEQLEVDVAAHTPLLWVLREELKLKGTKFGCGKGLCGACTVHIDKQATRSCILPVEAAVGKKVSTIESLKKDHQHPVQKAWIKHGVAQCGYCQPGQVMKAIALIESRERWEEKQLLEQMSGNICRCGTYHKIRKALLESAKEMEKL